MYLTIKLQLQATHDEKQILRAYSRRFQDEVERIIRRYQKLGSVIFIPYKWVSSDIAFYSKNQVLHYAKTLYSCLAKAFLFLNCVSEPKYINSSGSGYGVGNW